MRKPYLLLFICCFGIISSFAQSFQVGHKQQTFIDPARANRSIAAHIYYPATTAGDEVAPASGSFPVLVFGHGFVMNWSAYDVVWSALVPKGYIMVFPTTEGSFSPSHINLGKDMAFLVSALRAEGNNAASPFFEKVAPTAAVMGHSMGGGASFLAMQADSSITAIATLAPANTNPSSITAAQSISRPALIFSGANDCITPAAEHQQPMYDSLASSCKTFISITGGSHCQFGSFNFNCNIGEMLCTPHPDITREAQQATTFALLGPWLDFELKGDCAAGNQFQNLISAGAGIASQQNCTLACTGLLEPGAGENYMSVVHSAFSTSATIQIHQDLKNLDLKVFDMLGKEVRSIKNINAGDIEINGEQLQNGVYVLCLMQDNRLIASQKLVF